MEQQTAITRSLLLYVACLASDVLSYHSAKEMTGQLDRNDHGRMWNNRALRQIRQERFTSHLKDCKVRLPTFDRSQQTHFTADSTDSSERSFVEFKYRKFNNQSRPFIFSHVAAKISLATFF